MKKFQITADGARRLDILGRITLLFSQRHIDVESMTFKPVSNKESRYSVIATATEDTINRVASQIAHIIGIQRVSFNEI